MIILGTRLAFSARLAFQSIDGPAPGPDPGPDPSVKVISIELDNDNLPPTEDFVFRLQSYLPESASRPAITGVCNNYDGFVVKMDDQSFRVELSAAGSTYDEMEVYATLDSDPTVKSDIVVMHIAKTKTIIKE